MIQIAKIKSGKTVRVEAPNLAAIEQQIDSECQIDSNFGVHDNFLFFQTFDISLTYYLLIY